MLNISHHSLLALRVSAEISDESLMGVPLCVICGFSFVALRVLSLSLIFVILITVCLVLFLFDLILYGTLCASWTWITVSFPRLGRFFSYYLFRYFLGPFPLYLLFLGAPIIHLWLVVLQIFLLFVKNF